MYGPCYLSWNTLLERVIDTFSVFGSALLRSTVVKGVAPRYFCIFSKAKWCLCIS